MSRRSTTLSCAALAGSVALALTGCSGTPATPSASSAGKAVTVVATTIPLGDLSKQITDCAGGTTTTLMPEGADAHEWTMSSAEASKLMKATLVVANGLELEGGIEDILDNAAKDGAKVFTVADKIDPIPFGEAGHDHEHDHAAEASATPTATPAAATPAATASADAHGDHDGHHHGDKDPHFWLDASKGAKAAEVIAAELAKTTGDAKYTECGKKVHDAMMDVDKQVTQTLSKVPAEKRILVTDHEAFGYFAAKYGFEQAGAVIPGGSTNAEPSSAEIAKLVEVIKEEKVPAIFSNTAVNPKVVETVAKEAGQQIKVVPLNVVSTNSKAGVNTYADMLLTNAKLIADALA